MGRQAHHVYAHVSATFHGGDFAIRAKDNGTTQSVHFQD